MSEVSSSEHPVFISCVVGHLQTSLHLNIFSNFKHKLLFLVTTLLLNVVLLW